MIIPSNLLSDRSPEHQVWLAELPDLVTKYAREWDITLGAPFQPGGFRSWVSPAQWRGKEVVFRLSRDPVQDAALAYSVYNGRGAPLLFASSSDALLRSEEHTS